MARTRREPQEARGGQQRDRCFDYLQGDEDPPPRASEGAAISEHGTLANGLQGIFC